MTNFNDIISRVKKETDSVILFHSATGKDSIMLADICFKNFKTVQLIYMYFVPGMEHIEKYIQWTESKYNTKFIQTPHYALGSYVKNGYMGCKKDPLQKKYSLSDIVERIKIQTGIEWVIMGFKQADGLNRRLMLKGYDLNAINYKNKKAYPLSEWKNSQVLQYIEVNNLIQPLRYNNLRSQDQDLSNDLYLYWLKTNYPNDFELTCQYFPACRHKLYEYEFKKNTESSI